VTQPTAFAIAPRVDLSVLSQRHRVPAASGHRPEKKKLDASSGLLATRRRLWHREGSSALRSAFVV